LFFQKNWSKLLLILFLCFLHCSSTSKTQRTFVTLQFVAPTTQKFFNLVKEWGKYWRQYSLISTYSVMGGSTVHYYNS
jgi:hypothetical protein